MLDRYVAQVRLLVNVLPDIAQETSFALKGGTAINLFYRNLPRLSVDIDLIWLPVADRPSSLQEIDEALDRITAAVTRRNPRVDARRIVGGGGGDTRIMVRDGQTRIKIETYPVTRGTAGCSLEANEPEEAQECRSRKTCRAAQSIGTLVSEVEIKQKWGPIHHLKFWRSLRIVGNT